MAKKKLEITDKELVNIKPITENQKRMADAWKSGKHLFLYGVAGTGKTFLSLYLALKEVLNDKTEQQRVYLVRSLLPTRDIGFLPGDEEDKAFLYQMPYQQYSFLSDIYKGTPSSQQVTQISQTQDPSTFQQIAGLGIAGLSAASGAKAMNLLPF